MMTICVFRFPLSECLQTTAAFWSQKLFPLLKVQNVLVSWEFWPSSCVYLSSLDVSLVCLGLYISFCGPFPSCCDYSHMFWLHSASLPCVFKSLCFLLSLSVHCVFSIFWALHCLLKLTFRSKSDFFWLPTSLFLVAVLSAVSEQNWREKRAVETTIVDPDRLHNHIQNCNYLWHLGTLSTLNSLDHLAEHHQTFYSNILGQGAQTSVSKHTHDFLYNSITMCLED